MQEALGNGGLAIVGRTNDQQASRARAARFARQYRLQACKRLARAGVADPAVRRHEGEALGGGQQGLLVDLGAEMGQIRHRPSPLLDIIDRLRRSRL